MFFDCTSFCNWFKASVWSLTIICANCFTAGFVALLATILPSSTSARLPLAASSTNFWSAFALVLEFGVAAELLEGCAELGFGLAAVLLPLQPTLMSAIAARKSRLLRIWCIASPLISQ